VHALEVQWLAAVPPTRHDGIRSQIALRTREHPLAKTRVCLRDSSARVSIGAPQSSVLPSARAELFLSERR